MHRYQLKTLTLGLLVLLLVLCQGCSQRTWFQGFVAGQQFQCNKLAGQERTNCLEAIPADYDRYQKERQEHLQENR